jgi:hypothetical protein
MAPPPIDKGNVYWPIVMPRATRNIAKPLNAQFNEMQTHRRESRLLYFISKWLGTRGYWFREGVGVGRGGMEPGPLAPTRRK